MSCNRPLPAYRTPGSGTVRIGYDDGSGRAFEVPCGKCFGCKMDKAREWAIRIRHEAQRYDCNLCVTLDYRPEDLPRDRSLHYEDFQGFMKRLRRRVESARLPDGGRSPIRFFVAGEYGEKYGRPHFHAILFNPFVPDLRPMHNGKLSSCLLEDIWGKGKVVIDRLNPAAAAYVAGYTLKKAKAAVYADSVVDLQTGELSDRVPPFVRMSLKPGIGSYWYASFGRDILPRDFVIVDGCKRKVPRYYYKILQAADAVAAEEVAWRRELRAAEQRSESTPERRAVREELLVRRSRFEDSHSL